MTSWVRPKLSLSSPTKPRHPVLPPPPVTKRPGTACPRTTGAGNKLLLLQEGKPYGGPRRIRSLALDPLGAGAIHILNEDRHVPAGTVQMRLDHLQRERGRNPGVEG